ncbi:MAG: hypothetical protein IT555_13395 [Acetobacteraceae bacterium]|nr:hypothetical protein [Acetobacteraceae bacterium]
MENDSVFRERYAKATNTREAVEARVAELTEMGALDVELSSNDLFWIITFQLP